MISEIPLKVIEALKLDVGHGRARLDTVTRDRLGLLPGDIIQITGDKTTAAIVWRAPIEDEGKGIIRIDNLIRKNAAISMGDKVTIKKAEVKNAVKVILALAFAGKEKIQFGTGMDDIIKKNLSGRPVAKGDLLLIQGIAIGGALPFGVVNTNPKGIVQININTNIMVKDEPLKETELKAPQITYEDIGGLEEELRRVREMIELPLRHPELFERLGIDPPKGVLLHGPPGTGKTLIAKAVANEAGANFLSIQGPEIMSKYYGESEAQLRKKYEDAEKNAPSIIFIDEIDSIAPKREDVHGEVERRVVAQMLSLMDGLRGRGKVIVIAATNRVDAIDPALRRPGRFDREIEVGVPDKKGRKEILQVHTRNMPFEENFNREYFANITHGFVGADLAALAREAAMKALRRYLPEIDLENPISAEMLEKMIVTTQDFKNALKEIEPSALREVLIEVPTVRWTDVGGLEDIKQQLKEAVELPLKNKQSFQRLGIRAPKGVLLFGAPGTGKTLLAKAVACESEANFISIKGPEILSKWVGESEKAVREIFKKAKQSAPSIVFLDEIDSIAPRRGLGGDSHATERVVNQLLTSIDGLESMEDVVVLAATNRPDIIDTGLLRAGRFDRLLLIPQPDKEARLKIFKIHTKEMPIDNINLDEMADKTEGYTGADIELLCREAGLRALRKDLKADKVTDKHFIDAMKSIKPSLDDETVKYYEKIGKELAGGIDKRKKEDYVAGYR